MDIKICVYPTEKYPSFIACTNVYKVRDKYARQFRVLMGGYSKLIDGDHPYSIKIYHDIRYLPYLDGRAFEILLDYYARREEEYIYDNK